MVWGHSRWDHAVWGNDEDDDRIDRVLALLRPGRDRASVSQKDLRDSMHFAPAIRYGANAFVTMDGAGRGKGMLKRAPAVHDAFPGFQLWTPAQASNFAERLLHNRELRRRNPLPKPGELPDNG